MPIQVRTDQTNPKNPRRPFGRGGDAPAPSILDLVRLSPKPILPPGGEALYRQIAILTEAQPGHEVLDAGCGRGIAAAFLAGNYGVEVTGLDPDPAMVAEAEQRARSLELDDLLHFQSAPLHDLPFKDDVFDIAIGEVGLGAFSDPALAVRELARVTKPFGHVVLVQLAWAGNVDEERRELLVERLGTRPMLLVEWKQLLREAGCVEIHVEDWSDSSRHTTSSMTGPFADITTMLSLRTKIALLRRALARWGWRGVRRALVRERDVHQLLTRRRVLGLTLIKATKWNADMLPDRSGAD